MARIGLVVEGSNDYPVLETLIAAILGDQEHIFVRLQPMYDATSGKNTDGGCSRVVAWCLDNAGDRILTYFTPLSDDDQPLDILVVHLDGDTLESCSCHAPGVYDGRDVDIEERLLILSEMINFWVRPPEIVADKITHALPVTETEAWILAAIEPGATADIDWESCDAKDQLLTRYPRSTESIAGYYLNHSRSLSSGIASIRLRCKSFGSFESALLAAA